MEKSKVTAKEREWFQAFWRSQRQKVEQASDFKNLEFPTTRILKIMKADRDVHMVAREAIILFSKACEIFVLDLTTRSWFIAEKDKRHTLHDKDIAATIICTDIFDFILEMALSVDDDIEFEEMAACIRSAEWANGIQPAKAAAGIESTEVASLVESAGKTLLPSTLGSSWDDLSGKDGSVPENFAAVNPPLLPLPALALLNLDE